MKIAEKYRTQEGSLIAKEGYAIVSLSLLLAVVAFFLHPFASVVFLLWAVFCVYFFRNPLRNIPQNEAVLVSPADGRVISVERILEREFLQHELLCVSIFMSPLNVHVNRMPISGVVRNVLHRRGRFWAAFSENASAENERAAVHIYTAHGEDVVFVQIAGWLARRIFTYPLTGETVSKGKICGVIRFGSRVDVYLPDNFIPKVSVGDKVRSGESVLAVRG